MRNTKKGISLIVMVVSILVIAVVITTTLVLVNNKEVSIESLNDNVIQDDNSNKTDSREEQKENKNNIVYNNIKIKVGNGNLVGLGTSVNEFVEQTGIEFKDRTGDFNEDYTYTGGSWKDAKIWYNERPVGDARFRNSYDEPKNYSECILIYIGFNSLTEDMNFYYKNKEIKSKADVVSLLGEPDQRMASIQGDFYTYAIEESNIAPNMNLQLKLGFDASNDKIVKIYIGCF